MKRFVCIVLAVIAGGCLPSLYPLYTDQTVVFEEKLIGKWSSDDGNWCFSQDYKRRSKSVPPGGAKIYHLLYL